MTTQPQLAGQTVVVIGGSSGIGLETARRARLEGAKVIITARNKDRLHEVGQALDAEISAFDALDFERLGLFFDELPTPIDHVLVSGSGPYYAPLAEFDFDKARRDVDAHLWLQLLTGDRIEARREELRKRLPIGRVVGPEDVAAPATGGGVKERAS
jgi:NAD(P)-dependent dehydrogenase (short-subunit alcohol dehydrogenase family)